MVNPITLTCDLVLNSREISHGALHIALLRGTFESKHESVTDGMTG